MGDRLETELSELTRWEGGAPGLWARALEAEEAVERDASSDRVSFWNRPLRMGGLVGALSAAACLVLVVSIMLPSLGRVRSSARMETPRRGMPLVSPPSDEGGLAGGLREGQGAGAPLKMEEAEGPERHVVREVTVELLVDDVSAAYMKARRLVSEANGEYVEESALSTAGGRANVTLRVSVARLSGLLDELRVLGEVTDEKSRGEDVTDQVVDLGARIGNELRVEKELLELLESRADAPLEDLLLLRSEVDRVRTSIERMRARQERLSRLVSLASVLVIIRAADEPVPEPASASLWDGFATSLGEAWRSGVRVLGSTLAGIVGVLVGGMVWWVLIAALVLGVRHRLRSMPEPAP